MQNQCLKTQCLASVT